MKEIHSHENVALDIKYQNRKQSLKNKREILVAKKAGLIPPMYSTLWKKCEYSLALHLLNFVDCTIWKDASVILLEKIVVFKSILKEPAGILRQNW